MSDKVYMSVHLDVGISDLRDQRHMAKHFHTTDKTVDQTSNDYGNTRDFFPRELFINPSSREHLKCIFSICTDLCK